MFFPPFPNSGNGTSGYSGFSGNSGPSGCAQSYTITFANVAGYAWTGTALTLLPLDDTWAYTNEGAEYTLSISYQPLTSRWLIDVEDDAHACETTYYADATAFPNCPPVGASNWTIDVDLCGIGAAVAAVTNTYSGLSGYSGAGGAGTSGYSGFSGKSGTGQSGYSGATGTGLSGYSGFGLSGYSGFSGFSGLSGYSGFGLSGFSGYSGYSGANACASTYHFLAHDEGGTIGQQDLTRVGTTFEWEGSGYTLDIDHDTGNWRLTITNGEGGATVYEAANDGSCPPISTDIFDDGIWSITSDTAGLMLDAIWNGYLGQSGSQGVSGFSGYSGKSGYSGSGISGYSGKSGYSGSGLSGYSGFSGLSGYSGIGLSGYSGFSGSSGKSGYSGSSLNASLYFLEVTFGEGNGGDDNFDFGGSGAGFPQIQFSQLDNYSLTDPGSNYNATNDWYVVPATGVYRITTKLRVTDGAGNPTSYGQGADTTAGDGPNFGWFITTSTSGDGSNRNSSLNVRVSPYSAGDQIIMFAFADDTISASDGAMTIERVY